MSFQFLNPAPVFFDLPGAEPLAGGFLQFYDKGTTTPRDTWSDEALTVLNPNPVPLDAAGRAEFAIWLEGEYSVKAESATGETIWTRDYTSGQTAGATIPPLQADRFLTNDGVSMFWALLRMLPDPSGFANQALVTDGANFLFRPFPEAPEVPDPEIVITDSGGVKSVRVGISSNPKKFLVQFGSDSAPATGGRETNKNVSFVNAFDQLWYADAIPTSQSNAGGPMVRELTTFNAAGINVLWTIAAGSGADAKINNSVPFLWVAFGTVNVAP